MMIVEMIDIATVVASDEVDSRKAYVCPLERKKERKRKKETHLISMTRRMKAKLLSFFKQFQTLLGCIKHIPSETK